MRPAISIDLSAPVVQLHGALNRAIHLIGGRMQRIGMRAQIWSTNQSHDPESRCRVDADRGAALSAQAGFSLIPRSQAPFGASHASS